MQRLTDFEKSAKTLLCQTVLPQKVLKDIIETESFEYEHTGVGYFINIRHNDIPKPRIVCDVPFLLGTSRDKQNIQTGFVVFIEGNELTLECHSFGENLPEDYRTQSVTVRIKK